MTFDEVLMQVVALLQREGRVAYRVLKRRFALDDEYIEDLKADLIDAKRLAIDEDGKVLVWMGKGETGKRGNGETENQPSTFSDARLWTLDARPISYTPPHLTDRIRAEWAAMEARGVGEGERRIITAVFSDTAGFTALAHGLDPEVVRALIDPALQLMMDAVHRYEGFVAQSLGDGIFALFGAPIAHEDHPQRALYAALLMQEEMRRYSDKVRLENGVPIQIRVGINTGEVVLRSIRKDDLHADYLPVGHSTNLASRMENLATPGSIVVSENTYKLIEGYFECKALGAVQVKGIEEPVNIYEVLGVGPLRTRLQVAARRGLVRFVGRQNEVEHLRRALESVKAGHGQIAGVMGEPGVGKSRLFHEFKLLSQRGCLVLEAFSVSHGKAYAYLPLIELLKNYFQITAQDDERKRREKIGGKVLMLDRSLEDTLPYLFALLSVSEPNSSLQQMDPQIRRKRTLEAIKQLLVRESLNQPLILIFEDLHWLDGETQAFLDLLSESIATARILLLVNYRPEYRHEWSNKTFYTQLRLDPLGQVEAQEMLAALLGDDAALHSLKQFILAKTEGNPFFMEEIVQALREQGILTDPRRVGTAHLDAGATGRSPLPTDLRLPTTVQAVLASRIDRLPSEKKALLQTLSVLGKEFPFSLLKQVADKSEADLHRLLSQLQNTEFIYEQPAFPEVEYTFKHALTQEVAYSSLLQDRRKALHERIAQAIEALFHPRLEDHYGELARHYTRSGNTQKAIVYLQLAGRQAAQRSAYAEAIDHFTTALELLKPLPDTLEHKQQELALQVALGPMVVAGKGFAIPEVKQIYTRAWELCQQVEAEPSQLFPVVMGLRGFHHIGGALQTAREWGEQLVTLAQGLEDQTFFVLAHRALGATLSMLGEFTLAREHLEQSMALYDPRLHRLDPVLFGQDPGLLGRGYLAWTLWSLGYPAQALERIHDAFTVAREMSRPVSLATALYVAVTLHQYRREEWYTAQEQAEALISLCTEHGIPSWLATGIFHRGWALAGQGQTQEGIAQMREGLTALRATGVELQQSQWLTLLAEAYGKAGRTEEGLDALAEALTIVDKRGERYYEAEIYRLKGQLTLQSKTSPRQVEDKSQTSHEQVTDKSQASRRQVENNSENANTQAENDKVPDRQKRKT